MHTVFLTVLNMTFTASFVITVIIAARLCLKRTPKVISYILWAAAGFRLIFPFSFSSVISLIPFSAQPIPQDIAMQAIPRIDTGIPLIDNAISGILPAPPAQDSVNPLQIWTSIGATIWIIGIIAMLTYSIVSVILLKRRLDNAALAQGNIYEADGLRTPFVLGIFRPKIYIPAGLSGCEKEYVILHERTHIRRHDTVIKLLAFFILCLHWFNPLVWAAFVLMSADMEMSCDERVLKETGAETKKAYSMSLLSLAAGRRIINGSPLAFGEGSTEKRIKNVLNFKKHSKIIITIAAVLAAALIVGFTVNRVGSGGSGYAQQTINTGRGTISMDLPKGMSFAGSGSTDASDFFGMSLSYIMNGQTLGKIMKAGEEIGAVAVATANITDDMFSAYKDDPLQNYRAVYYPLPMGSMNFAGTKFMTVYESADMRQGTATDLICYRSDFFAPDSTYDLSHMLNEPIEGDTRSNYYAKSVYGYNVDLQCMVVIELYYDAVTDEQLRQIAETLRITG